MIRRFRSHWEGEERFAYIDTDFIVNAWLDTEDQYKDQVVVILKDERQIILYMSQKEFEHALFLTTNIYGTDVVRSGNINEEYREWFFFKLFKDDYDSNCVDILNQYLERNPNLKVISSQMMQYTESNYGSNVLNRWNPENTRLANRILVQFETD